MQSAVLPQYTFWTDTQIDGLTHRSTNRWDRLQLDSISAYARYTNRVMC